MWEREGVSLNELNTKQQESAFALMESGLSAKGYQKARAIINLETTLGEIEKSRWRSAIGARPWDSIFSLFSAIRPVTVRGDGVLKDTMFHLISPSLIVNLFHQNPSFFGSNPAEVPSR